MAGDCLCKSMKQGVQTVTGTLLIDFCVTPSCVTAVTDNTFCRSCYFPSCYCVVLQYPVPMSDSLFNAFSLEVSLPHQDTLWQNTAAQTGR